MAAGADRPSPDVEPVRSPDEVEQRQRPDGTFEGERIAEDGGVEPHPDVLEQRLRADGSLDESWSGDDVPEPHPDVLEQRQVVELDDEDAPWDGGSDEEER